MKQHCRFTLSALTLAAAVALSACADDSQDMDGMAGTGAEASSSQVDQDQAAAPFNDADVQFASGMVPHHQQAVMMSELAIDQGGPEVAGLAERIQAAQDPEIDTMTQWLQDWGADAPMDMDDMGAADHDMGMEGMMSPEDMQALMAAEGEEFDVLWLEMMIEHHEGAISMAESQQEDGKNPEAVTLAATIAETQAAEIAEMQAMLADLG